MKLKLTQIAQALGMPLLGNARLSITGAAEPSRAGPDDIAIALSPRWADGLAAGQARAALVWPGADWRSFGLEAAIEAPRGRLAMAALTAALDPALPAEIHPSAVIDPGAQIGAGVRIGAHVSVAAGAVIGAGCVLHPGVRIGRNVRLEARVILQPNVVIGSDGFSFVTAEPAHVETARKSLGTGPVPQLGDPRWHRIHSLGGVSIGDDVEIGAGSTVDAGTLRETQIGAGTKVDNLVQIGHNVVIGAHCLLCAQAGVAGSTTIGDRTVVGGKAGIADNLTIGADVVLGGGSIVLSNVPDGRVMLGYPATRMDRQVESYKALRRLPRILARLKEPKG